MFDLGRRRSDLCIGADRVCDACIYSASQSRQDSQSSADDPYRQLSRFGAVFEAVRKNYVEASDEGKMIKALIEEMAASLDPDTSFDKTTAT
jgi:hypothetical protein